MMMTMMMMSNFTGLSDVFDDAYSFLALLLFYSILAYTVKCAMSERERFMN